MDQQIKISLIDLFCETISIQVTRFTNKKEQRTYGNRVDEEGQESKIDNDAERFTIHRVVNLSKEVMKLLDIGLASTLDCHKLDEIIRESLFGLYHTPSVAKWFENDTLAFYNWWGRHIVVWSKCSKCRICHQRSRHHLKTMIQGMRDHLLPPPQHCSVQRRSSGVGYRHYSVQRVGYEKVSPMGRALNAYLCDLVNFPNPLTTYHGNALWFLKEIIVDDEEQSSSATDTSKIAKSCEMNQCYKRKRSSMSACSWSNPKDLHCGKRKRSWSNPKDPRADPGIAFALKLLADRYEQSR